ncbi:MAG TPA: methylmalonyl-CoA mutase family protein [Kofleriaceae bacterium]|jgi:methylmalonyl-CoA mutase
MATVDDWRALVEKELAGVSFDKALVHRDENGIALQPLYTELTGDPGSPGAAPFVRGAKATAIPFGVCMKVDNASTRRPDALAEDLDGGADALWIDREDDAAFHAASERGSMLVVDVGSRAHLDLLSKASGTRALWLGVDPIDGVYRGRLDPGEVPARLKRLSEVAGAESVRGLRISALTTHAAGADAVTELALMLSTAVAYLRALVDAGRPVKEAVRSLWVQVAIGRDTFGELCKLRALRLTMHKVFVLAGAPHVPLDAIHAVCSSRTQATRDPWVNMLRVTTEVFAAVLGGAQLVSPRPFDEALGVPSALARRVARNTALVLREESHLGRVIDAAGGAYYIEARTDALARAAWDRFQQIENGGGIVELLSDNMRGIRAFVEPAWAKRADDLSKRKAAVLGVSEFANLTEQLPTLAPTPPGLEILYPPLAIHREAEGWEALRAKAEASKPQVTIVTLGPASEHRARVGFVQNLFAAIGVTPKELAAPGTRSGTTQPPPIAGMAVGSTAALPVGALSAAAGSTLADRLASAGDNATMRADVAVLCGSDERYATDAANVAKQLKAAGAKKVVIAGRPGDLEAALREAGVDAFVFMGADVLATLDDLVGGAA